jgi:hypothetical protein
MANCFLKLKGMTGKVGNNLAISQVHLDGPKAKEFVDAFAKSKKQIAISDGIGETNHTYSPQRVRPPLVQR